MTGRLSDGSGNGRGPWLRFAALLCVLLLICVGTVWNNLYANSLNTVVVEDKDSLPLSINGHRIEQALRLEGALRKILLSVSAPSAGSYRDAKVTFTIRQDDGQWQKTVPANGMLAGFELDTRSAKLHEGDAVLSVEGQGLPEGTDLFLYASQENYSRLAPSTMDGSITPGPLLMHYTVLRHDGYFAYDTVFLVLLVCAIVIVAWLMAFQRERLTRGKGLYFCCFGLLFIYISLSNPMATFLADPRSEMVYEFWYKAKSLSFFNNLMSLMSEESLVWTERVMMWLAVRLAGDGKNVFVIAQLMQTAMICAVTSMLCLPTFRKYLPPEVRFLCSFYMGGMMLFPSAYYFWGVSYWACFFLVPFAFVDMQKLRGWQWAAALIVTIVLCVSRIYHILLIPMAILALIALGKARGRRFSCYCIVVAAASAFEVVYSILAGGEGHLDMTRFRPFQFISNAFYYQVQVINSLFFGQNVTVHGGLLNAIVLAMLIAIVAFALYLLISGWKNLSCRTYGCVLLALGILSLGSVGINVVVSGCSSTVQFPINYASLVKWNKTFYQNGDLHFSYSYFATVGVFLTILIYMRQNKAVVLGEWTGRSLPVLFTVVIMVMVIVNVREYVMLRMVETSWKSYYWVTEQDSYYMPVNVVYPSAKISMYHNSDSIVCGLTHKGKDALWNELYRAYALTDYAYHAASPGKISDLEERQMLSLSVQRYNVNFADPIYLVARAKDGTELLRMPQTNTPDRYRVDFMLSEPLVGAYSVAFEYEDGSEAYVCSGMQIGVVSIDEA